MDPAPDARFLEGADLDAANEVYSRLKFQLSRPGSDRTFGSFAAGAPIALGRLQRHDDGAIELGGIWVDEARRGTGLARGMVAHVIEQAAEDEVLWCIPFLSLEGFYRSCGLAPVDPSDAPPSIRAKLDFCETQRECGHYAERVSLLVRWPPR